MTRILRLAAVGAALAALAPLPASAVVLDGIWGLGLGGNADDPSLSTPSNQLSDPFAIPLTVGGPAVTFNLNTFNPGGSCYGAGCTGGPYGTFTDSVGLGLTGLQLAGMGSPDPIQNYFGTFTAKYSGAILGCAAGDGNSPNPGATDCVTWTGGGNTGLYNGVSTFTVPLNGTNDVLTVKLANATDWSVTPSVSFQVSDLAAPVPEPASLVLLGAGVLGLGLARKKRS